MQHRIDYFKFFLTTRGCRHRAGIPSLRVRAATQDVRPFSRSVSPFFISRQGFPYLRTHFALQTPEKRHFTHTRLPRSAIFTPKTSKGAKNSYLCLETVRYATHLLTHRHPSLEVCRKKLGGRNRFLGSRNFLLPVFHTRHPSSATRHATERHSRPSSIWEKPFSSFHLQTSRPCPSTPTPSLASPSSGRG